MRQINPSEAAALLTSGAQLLDVREPNEWEAGHAPAAVHIPMNAVMNRVDEVSATQPVVVVCRSGARSNRVAGFLEQTGREAHNLSGGMQAWQLAGFDVVTDAGAAGRVA